jgi:hypothetical protein
VKFWDLYILVDILRLLMIVEVHAKNIRDLDGTKLVVERVQEYIFSIAAYLK